MQLVSYEFLLFMAVLLLLYYVFGRRIQWIVLLTASCVFYLCSGIWGFFFLLTTTISIWAIALAVDAETEKQKQWEKENAPTREEKREHSRSVKRKQKHIMIGGLVLNFGILAVLKYTNFIIGTIDGLFFPQSYGLLPVNWLLPLGISYYTFQATGYLIDVYHRKYRAEKNLGHFALFVSFFPQMIQGPISRFDELSGQFFKEHRFDLLTIKLGLMRVLWGYFKKLVIADRIAPAVILITQNPEQFGGAYVWIGMFSYLIWMYADFSGGIDIVIGIAQLFGIQLPENFERPFFSKSLAEFWRRWHMSLMRWLREYIFFPVSTSALSKKCSDLARKVFGKGAAMRAPLYLSTVVVWLVTGIWHGASWNFVAWGMANCIVLLISQELAPLYKRFRDRYSFTHGRFWDGFSALRTTLLFCFIEMFEYYPFTMMWRMVASMFFDFRISQLAPENMASLGLAWSEWLLLILGVALMFTVSMAQRSGSVRLKILKRPAWQRFALIYGLFLIILITGVYGFGYDASSFIYNQF